MRQDLRVGKAITFLSMARFGNCIQFALKCLAHGRLSRRFLDCCTDRLMAASQCCLLFLLNSMQSLSQLRYLISQGQEEFVVFCPQTLELALMNDTQTSPLENHHNDGRQRE